jgi:hypothetical protein
MAQTATTGSRPRGAGWWLWLPRQRSFQLTAVVWLVLSLAVPFLAGPGLPFDRPSLEGQSVTLQLLNAESNLVLALGVIALTMIVTRHRVVPDLAARVPSRAMAWVEVSALIAYGVLIQAVGMLVGKMIGSGPISAHMVGSIYASREPITPTQALDWAVYNFVLYAAMPYLVFRVRGYSNAALSLHSSDRANDALLIVVVLLFEGAVELAFIGGGFFSLSTTQKLLGVPLATVFNFVGTVLSVMIYLYAILLPRFLKLTGSVPATIVLGGLGYTAMHVFDHWAVYDGFVDGTLSVIFLLLQYFGPGMVKSVLTIRTGNAWVHALAYHAIAPHAYVDAPNLVRIFRIR